MTPNATQQMLSQTKAKNGCPSCVLLLLTPRFLLDKHIQSISSFIYLSRAWFVCDPVAIVSAPVWGRTCVYCIYYGMQRKERAGWSACALWCHIQVCETVCFFNTMQLSAPFLREMPRAGGHIRDGHHDSYPNWVGCAVNAW